MVDPDRPEYRRTISYASERGFAIVDLLGFGIDGRIYMTSVFSVVKAFEREAAYRNERDVYFRLREHGVSSVGGHAVPQLLGWDDERRVIEMSLVQPPYLLDFAKARLDEPPDCPEEVMQERRAHWADLFGDRWPQVVHVMRELERRCGIHLLDPNPRNITFEGE